MIDIPRRTALAAAAAAAALPRLAIGQTQGHRPDIAVAVQKVSNSNTLDSLSEQSNVGTRLSILFAETLIGVNYQGQLEQIPGLATAWRRIDDRTVELDLRRGVKFHNGDEMTAEDVAFTFSAARMFGNTRPTVNGKTMALTSVVTTSTSRDLPPQVPPVARRIWPALDRVDIVDKYTVRFVNATPDVTMEGRLSARGSEIVSKRGFLEAKSWLDYARRPIGTGAYKVAEFRPDDQLIMVAHDEYWGGRPPIRQLRLIEVPEVSARVNGLLSGDYQFACDIPPDQIHGIEAHPAFEVLGGTIPNHRMTAFDMHHPVLRDPRVRLAMAHSIDRQAIVDSLWDGRTVIPQGMQWPFFGDMFVKSWHVPDYNLDTARSLLKAAGYKGDAIPYRLLNDYYTNQVATSQVLVEMWKQAGLNVQIAMKENWTQIFEHPETRGVRDWSNSAPFNDPVSAILAEQGPNGEQQQRGEWTNAEMNQLSPILQSSTDRAKRHAVFKRMLEICERDDPAYTVLHQNATFTAKPRRIKWKAAPSFAMDFRAQNWGV